MAYTIERAVLIASQLERLAHAQLHQLAGQVANFDFWLDEAVQTLATIDDYPRRFQRLRESQLAWVRAHGTRVSGYCPICGGGCEFDPQTPTPPWRLQSEELEAARSKVRQSAYRLLLRCHRSRLLDEAAVRAACDRLGLTAEPEDLERPADDGEDGPHGAPPAASSAS
jgi:hypothetical protein